MPKVYGNVLWYDEDDDGDPNQLASATEAEMIVCKRVEQRFKKQSDTLEADMLGQEDGCRY